MALRHFLEKHPDARTGLPSSTMVANVVRTRQGFEICRSEYLKGDVDDLRFAFGA
jgi:hypothetical protein